MDEVVFLKELTAQGNPILTYFVILIGYADGSKIGGNGFSGFGLFVEELDLCRS